MVDGPKIGNLCQIFVIKFMTSVKIPPYHLWEIFANVINSFGLFATHYFRNSKANSILSVI